jgi:hypothetical protein
VHGNGLRKNGPPAGLDILERAVTTTAPGPGRGAAVALLARAAASADDPLAPLARDVARSLVEAGLTLHHGAPWHPLRRLGRVCLLPVARTCDPGGHGGIVVS